jgi:RES domain-containing protein
VIAYRIGTKAYAGTKLAAFGGQGSLYGDGRWHHRGRLACYLASHRSLAYLEILAHLERQSSIQPHVLWSIEIPDTFVTDLPVPLPKNWRTNLEATRRLGDTWLAGKTAVALRVPSAIIPSEFNYLLNPAHPAFDLAWGKDNPEPLEFDKRLI